MKKAQVLITAFAVLVLCTACAPAVAAPAATPTPTRTPVPQPTYTPAPTSAADPLREELEEWVVVCLLTPYQYLATLPVGERVGSISFQWVVAGAGQTHIHTIRVTEETWKRLTGYETFHFVSTYELTRSVSVEIVIDGRRVVLTPSVKECPPVPNPQGSV